MTEGVSVPETSLTQRTEQLPPYRVILHNDDVNTFEYVVQSVHKITPLKQADAVRCTLEAHETGAALLLVTHRERAELYVEQFASRAITVSCEPAAGG